MLEQFRILYTAVKLGRFTSKQLAEASGVAMGTVQKTLRRRKELFVAVKGPPTNKRGGQSLVHEVRADVVRAALQQTADSVDIPPLPTKKTGEPLSLILAEQTLCRVFPRAEPFERPELLNAANTNLDLVGSWHSGTVDELRKLATTLSALTDTQLRLAGLKEAADAASRDASLAAIESLLSFKERELREEVPGRLEVAASILAALPTSLAASHKMANEGAEVPPWWADVVASAWFLLAHPRWQSVVGDLVSNIATLEAAWKKQTTATIVAKISPTIEIAREAFSSRSGVAPLPAIHHTYEPKGHTMPRAHKHMGELIMIDALARIETALLAFPPDLIVSVNPESDAIAKLVAHDLGLGAPVICCLTRQKDELAWIGDPPAVRPRVVSVIGHAAFKGCTLARVVRAVRERFDTERVYGGVLITSPEALIHTSHDFSLVFGGYIRALDAYGPQTERSLQFGEAEYILTGDEVIRVRRDVLKSTRDQMRPVFEGEPAPWLPAVESVIP